MAKNKISELPYVEDGDTWFDNKNDKFLVHDGTAWNTYQPSFYINDSKGEKILEITSEGEVIWHGEPTAAAKQFCDSLTFNYEKKDGFKIKREEWQESHKKSIYKALEDGELTKEKLDEIFAKHKFHGKLRGDVTD